MAKKRTAHYSGIGGQAVLEGIMMKNKDVYSVAVRKPDGEIAVKVDTYQSIVGDSVLLRIPFVRGIFNFLDSLILGVRTLNFSASFYEGAGDPEENADTGKHSSWTAKLESLFSVFVTLVSIVLAVAIFILLPYFIIYLISGTLQNASLQALLEGVIRIVIFILYVVAISAMRDIRRVYHYHGAEHKCINCIEHGRALTVHNVMRSSKEHKRCGTSFLLFVMLVSVVLFFFIRVQSLWLRVLLRIVLIPVVAGIAYELIRLAGRSESVIVRIISKPGLWLQALTTKEPDESMVEVAIAAVEAVFDWKGFLKEEFGTQVEDEPEEDDGK